MQTVIHFSEEERLRDYLLIIMTKNNTFQWKASTSCGLLHSIIIESNHSIAYCRGWKTMSRRPNIAFFMNKISLNHINAHFLCIANGYFGIMKTELSSCNRDYMVHKAKNIYYLNLHRKYLTIPGLF